MTAYDAIRLGEYDIAATILEHNKHAQKDFYLLSLLYRMQDQYEQENIIVQQSLGLFPEWDYMLDRAGWHDRATFAFNIDNSKVVPRSPLHLDRDSNMAPTQEILEKTCFVSACNDSQCYFELLYEWIESIKATRLYKNIPIFILDLGLNDEQKNILHNLNIVCKDPGWDIPFSPEPPAYRKCIIARGFLDIHFPGYEYYFWFDADSWIQNELSLDHFLYGAQHVGLMSGRDIWVPSFLQDGGLKEEKIPSHRWNPEKFSQHPQCWGCVIAYKKDSPLHISWKSTMQEIAPLHGQPFWVDQNALNLVMIENSVFPLDAHHILPVWDENSKKLSRFDEDFYALFVPGTKDIIGIVGVHYKCVPFNNINTLQLQKDGSWKAIRQSFRYRVWPWQDKDWIKNEMQKLLTAF